MKRLQERFELDLEMIKELSYCLELRIILVIWTEECLVLDLSVYFDYFPKDYLMVIDESYNHSASSYNVWWNRSRKEALVEYGFRLPAAMDNRPLKLPEFEEMQNRVIYVFYDPADYELENLANFTPNQIIRTDWTLDPIIEVRPTMNQIDDLIEENSKKVVERRRTFFGTTLTKKWQKN